MPAHKPLQTLEVLIIDCQSTGANPARGHLLELAWGRICPRRASRAISSQLVALPEGEVIPRRVTALTGIQQYQMAEALPPCRVWERLLADVRSFGGGRVPTVIHFARFEQPFLEELHRKHGRGRFPLDLICAHEIASRLLPHLPRRGLRALAGYFGHIQPEHKRATAHVMATAVIWSALVDRLQEQGVITLNELRTWMASGPIPRRGKRQYPLARERRLHLPEDPGVYHLLAGERQVLYIGKAKSLRRRVNSYFQKQRHSRAERTLELLTQVRDVQVMVTASGLEAALLEADEIKRYTPPYNAALRRRDRRVWFATVDLSSISGRADDRYVVGPVLSKESLIALGMLARGSLDERWRITLGFPTEQYLDEDCFRRGLALFIQQHPPSVVSLMRLGTKLWRDRRQVSQEPDIDEEDDVERTWDAARVVSALESVVLRGAHLIRRAHWLQGLAESSLAWTTANGTDRRRRMLIIGRGRVVERGDLTASAEMPSPPGAHRSTVERLQAFDVATYDRLRVLTTELKRLVVDAERVELSLGLHRRLDRRALARRLYWM